MSQSKCDWVDINRIKCEVNGYQSNQDGMIKCKWNQEWVNGYQSKQLWVNGYQLNQEWSSKWI